MSDLTEVIVDAALARLKPWTDSQYGDLFAIAAERAVRIVLMEAESVYRADERAKVSEEIARAIEAELVCCDIAERIRAVANDSIAVTRLMERGSGYHAICHWGGAAAAIAREVGNRG